jgi:hypothetical protein
MQKLKGISSGENNKSCRIIYHESNEIGFAFLRFFYVFLCNLQESAKSQYIWVNLLQGSPRKEFVFRNVAPGRPAGAARSIPASLQPGLARDAREEGLGVP